MPERYNNKMKEFVTKLLTQPALAGQTIVARENQVLGFIKENGAQLQAAFRQKDFFPEISYEQAVRLLVTVLSDAVVREVEPTVLSALSAVSSKALMDALGPKAAPNAQELKTLACEQLRQKAARDQFFYSAQSVVAGFYTRYLSSVLKRRKLVYNELVRRDRLNIDPTLLPSYVGLAAMLRPFYWMRFSGSNGENLCLAESSKNGPLFKMANKELEAQLRGVLGALPEGLYQSAIDSCLSSEGDHETSGTARLVSILVNRSGDYHPDQKVDKGAETPDKSWFNINRRTAKFSGYDPKFLEELYQIAGEEGW